MSFRTIVIKERSKLDLKMNYLVCRNTKEIKVFIPEISVLILESTAISLTTALVSELVKNNVKIIFCDEKHNPESEVCSCYSSYNSSKKIANQIAWNQATKNKIWQRIIQNKIKQQRTFLAELHCYSEANTLGNYEKNVKENDETNREGHSAKVYFNALFGLDFFRRNQNATNSALNYGYAIILSCFNREIAKSGYLTQLGIWHKNEYNPYNLASDLMEPFRILVDRLVYKMGNNINDYKVNLLDLFNIQLKINSKMQFLENAISIYCQSIFNALDNNNEDLICFYE